VGEGGEGDYEAVYVCERGGQYYCSQHTAQDLKHGRGRGAAAGLLLARERCSEGALAHVACHGAISGSPTTHRPSQPPPHSAFTGNERFPPLTRPDLSHLPNPRQTWGWGVLVGTFEKAVRWKGRAGEPTYFKKALPTCKEINLKEDKLTGRLK
jgi:hypothetical protein